MTTIIYNKKKKYLAWDKKFVWWINIEWLEPKIWQIEVSPKITISFGTSWTCVMIWQIKNIILEVFNSIEWTEIEKFLYALKEEFIKTKDSEWSFWIILVLNIEWVIKAYYIQQSHCEEITRDFVSIWSWDSYALWIHWLDNDVDVKKIFEIVSSLDNKTSKEFDIINF